MLLTLSLKNLLKTILLKTIKLSSIQCYIIHSIKIMNLYFVSKNLIHVNFNIILKLKLIVSKEELLAVNETKF